VASGRLGLGRRGVGLGPLVDPAGHQPQAAAHPDERHLGQAGDDGDATDADGRHLKGLPLLAELAEQVRAHVAVGRRPGDDEAEAIEMSRAGICDTRPSPTLSTA
jgi:hypothetical protein